MKKLSRSLNPGRGQPRGHDGDQTIEDAAPAARIKRVGFSLTGFGRAIGDGHNVVPKGIFDAGVLIAADQYSRFAVLLAGKQNGVAAAEQGG